jgi:hypothetical protein
MVIFHSYGSLPEGKKTQTANLVWLEGSLLANGHLHGYPFRVRHAATSPRKSGAIRRPKKSIRLKLCSPPSVRGDISPNQPDTCHVMQLSASCQQHSCQHSSQAGLPTSRKGLPWWSNLRSTAGGQSAVYFGWSCVGRWFSQLNVVFFSAMADL